MRSPVSPDVGEPPVLTPVGDPPGAWPEGFVSGPPDREALLVLSHLVSMTPRSMHRLAASAGTARACLDAVRRGQAGTAADRIAAGSIGAAAVRKRLEAVQGRFVVPGDPEYPPPLLDLPDPPGWLYVRGRRLIPWPTAVAVVGARTCTAYGREVAAAVAGGLADAGVLVVSGAARGIDAAAHEGALRAGATAAILGSGIDVAYPRANRHLLDRIAETGAVLSEYPPGSPAVPRRFPARNRIVAALSRAVIVVEGAEGSGSLITAEFAQDLGREVMAVPGPVTGPLSRAPNGLIRDGGHLVTCAEDALDVLGLAAGPPKAVDTGEADAPEGLSADQRRVLDRLPGSPVTVEAVATDAGIDPARALRALSALELRGVVRSEGGRYRRSGPVGPAAHRDGRALRRAGR
jgi:DNA processing protein